MTKARIYRCDNCDRTSNDADGWGVLTTARRREELCRRCVAKVRGWDNPKVMGSTQRAREFYTTTIKPRRVQITGAL